MMTALKKILAAPLLAVLALLSALVSFLVCVVAAIGFVACIILVLLALVLLITGQPMGATVLLVLAFLASPFGLPSVAGWLVGGLDALRDAIRRRV